MNLSDGLSKGLRIQRSQEACLPFRLCLKAPLAVSSGRVSWLWDRAGSEAGIRNIPDSHTPLFTPLSMSELEGATVQAGILGLSWHPLCCSNTWYHCYVSNISQARNLRLMEEVNFLSWFLLFFWGGGKNLLLPSLMGQKSSPFGVEERAICLTTLEWLPPPPAHSALFRKRWGLRKDLHGKMGGGAPQALPGEVPAPTWAPTHVSQGQVPLVTRAVDLTRPPWITQSTEPCLS